MTKHAALRGLAGVLTATTLIVGCSDGGSAQGPEHSNSPDDGGSKAANADSSEGRAEPVAVEWGTQLDIRVELLTLARAPADAVIAKFRVTNHKQETLTLAGDFARELPHEPLPSSQVSGITLVDHKNHLRYLPLTDSNKRCLCTQFTSVTIGPRQSMEVYTYFPEPPDDVRRITVDFPKVGLLLDVPLNRINHPVELPTQLPGNEQQSRRRPSEIEATSKTVPLISRALDTESDSATERSGEDTTVQLSAQVLFDLNKASLRPEARYELRDVARRIQDAEPQVVKVDGHTDSSGSSDINIPLSNNRAEAVRNALQEMVGDADPEFVAEGHAAESPVAPNDTAEGRQKNRRVTVRFSQ